MKIRWTCPRCHRKNKWHWPKKYGKEIGPIEMECDHCGIETLCIGDGLGRFWPKEI